MSRCLPCSLLVLFIAAVFWGGTAIGTAVAQPPADVETKNESTSDSTDAPQPELWFGTLNVGVQRLRLLLEVQVGEADGPSAVLVSLDQGNSRIKVDTITWGDKEVSFAVDRIQASFQGTRDGNDVVVGKFNQGVEFPLTLTKVPSVPQEKVVEAWAGDLDASGAVLRLQFRRLQDQQGVETVLFDSLSQSATGLVAKWSEEDGKVRATVPAVRGTYEGTIGDDRQEIVGTWSQLGNSFELKLKRLEEAEQEPERKRPQMPDDDVPYQREEVSFRNAAADVKLAGTLTRPKGTEPAPAVVLVSGSGPQDRDETLMGHKPFLILADHLTRQGIAVLRFDDRGVGESTGEFGEAITTDFAADAESAVDYLLSRSDIDPKRIGIVGHSEGGIVASMLAARRDDMAHVVLLAGPGVAGDEIIRSQSRAIYAASGAAEKALDDIDTLMNNLIDAIQNDASTEKITELFSAFTADDDFEEDENDTASVLLQLQAKQMATPWFRYFIQYDPADDLRQAKVPVLAMIGEKDLQVLVDVNLPAIRAALAESGQSDFRCEELPGLNHLFQNCDTGSPAEYESIEETMNPAALQMIADWVLAH